MHKRVSVAISCHFLGQNATRSRQHAEKRPKWSAVTPKSRLIVVSCSPAASGGHPSQPTTGYPSSYQNRGDLVLPRCGRCGTHPVGCSPRSVPATALTRARRRRTLRAPGAARRTRLGPGPHTAPPAPPRRQDASSLPRWSATSLRERRSLTSPVRNGTRNTVAFGSAEDTRASCSSSCPATMSSCSRLVTSGSSGVPARALAEAGETCT